MECSGSGDGEGEVEEERLLTGGGKGGPDEVEAPGVKGKTVVNV